MSFHLKGTHEVVTKGGGLTFPIFTSLLSLTLMDKENILLVYKSLHERMRVARVFVNVYTNI